MMKFVFFLISLGVGLVNCEIGLPSFSWDEDHFSPAGIPLLIIHFPDGGNDDAAILKPATIKGCNFNGHLRDEPKAFVAMVGGCPFQNAFEIQVQSSRLNSFSFRVVNGVVHNVESVFRRRERGGEPEVLDIGILTEELTIKKYNKISNPIPFPANGFKMSVKFYYDQLFKTQFGAKSVSILDSISTLVQGYYRLPTLKTSITFVPTPHQEIPISLTDGAAMSSLTLAQQYIKDGTINANVFITFSNNQPGVVGLGWVGSVCYYYPVYRASVSEYYKSNSQTAEIVAHEIGHNLGMGHDFLNSDPTQGRNDRSGVSCKNIGSLMDYYQLFVTRWSTCSVEDFQDYFGKNQPFCMPANVAIATSTSTTTTKPSTTTTTASKPVRKNN